MISKHKIILYFGCAGALPSTFFIGRKIFLGEVTTFDFTFLINSISDLILGYIITALVSAAVIYSIVILDKYLPWDKGIWKRIIAEFFYTNFVAIFSIILIFQVTFSVGLSQFPYREHMIMGIIIAIVLNLFLTTFYEGIRMFSKWKQSLIESERLEKESIASKFEALKNQVNPHFLFNSLNTLSSLVHTDPAKAEIFIDEFSSIYRYVLENQERLVVSLKEELDFIKSFVFLLKIRFGEGLDFTIKIDGDKLHFNLPTLSLQLLVENEIKHNIVTKDKPLKITIFTEKDDIIIKNNLQYRNEKVERTGIGIENLKQRYQLLTNLRPVFIIENDYYIAKIPLIQPE